MKSILVRLGRAKVKSLDYYFHLYASNYLEFHIAEECGAKVCL